MSQALLNLAVAIPWDRPIELRLVSIDGETVPYQSMYRDPTSIAAFLDMARSWFAIHFAARPALRLPWNCKPTSS